MARADARPPRRRWPWIALGLAVAAVVVVAVVWFNRNTTATSTEPTSAPSSASSAPPSGEPTGCLGGDARDAEMVLAAQADAPRNSSGAVEVAAALTRWFQQFPYPSADDAATVGAEVFSSTTNFDLPAVFADEPDLSGGLVPIGTSYYSSTVPGVWLLESYSDDEAEVTIGAGLVIEGELHPTFRTSSTVTLRWESDAWHVVGSVAERSTESLFAAGTPFTEGC